MAHNLTVTVEDNLWDDMQKHPEIRWSVIMKEAVREKMKALSILNRLVQKNKLSEEEIEKFALKLGKKINQGS